MWIFLILLPVSFIAFFFGYLLYFKQKISIVHAYHWKKVKSDDIVPYTRLMGIAQFLIGISILSYSFLTFFNLIYVALTFLYCILAASFIIMHIAQKKYNKGWF